MASWRQFLSSATHPPRASPTGSTHPASPTPRMSVGTANWAHLWFATLTVLAFGVAAAEMRAIYLLTYNHTIEAAVDETRIRDARGHEVALALAVEEAVDKTRHDVEVRLGKDAIEAEIARAKVEGAAKHARAIDRAVKVAVAKAKREAALEIAAAVNATREEVEAEAEAKARRVAASVKAARKAAAEAAAIDHAVAVGEAVSKARREIRHAAEEHKVAALANAAKVAEARQKAAVEEAVAATTRDVRAAAEREKAAALLQAAIAAEKAQEKAVANALAQAQARRDGAIGASFDHHPGHGIPFDESTHGMPIRVPAPHHVYVSVGWDGAEGVTHMTDRRMLDPYSFEAGILPFTIGDCPPPVSWRMIVGAKLTYRWDECRAYLFRERAQSSTFESMETFQW